MGEGRWGVPLGVCCYISSPLSGTRQKGCRAERNGGRRGKRETEEGVERRFNNLRMEEEGEWMREENALNDDNKEKGTEREGRGVDRDIVLLRG